jgi:polysaccharide chain length determinant protein (PEP-CTERM system associated)
MALPKRNPSSILPALALPSIARMLWKQKVTIGAIWALVTGIACGVVLRIPQMYKAEALILVDSQKIPDRYVSSTVVSDAQDRLANIGQQILSSGRLEKIIEDFNLYPKERSVHFKEDILAMMREDIQTTPEKTWNGRTAAFRVSYQGRNPNIVAQVANKIANLYVEENLKARETQAEGTSEFIETQLKEAKEKLDELEAAVSQYKLQHNGELPQQEGSLNGILTRLGTELSVNRDAMNRAQQQKASLQDSLGFAQASEANQLRELQALPAATDAAASAVFSPAAPVPVKARKRTDDLQSQLTDLRLKYGEAHPDVRRVRILLEEAWRAESQKASEPGVEPPVISASGPKAGEAQKPRPVMETRELAQTRERTASLRTQLDVTNQETENLKREQQRIMGEISLYQGRVNGLPLREQEMAGLTRDYEISKTNYRSLLDKKIAAEMSTAMERREKSERFSIVDPARVPARPFKPDRNLLSIEGSLLGLALGLAMGFAKELHNATLLGEWELPPGTMFLGRLPYIEIAPASTPVATGAQAE